ncbi:MAG: hypothetical protein ACQKBY_12865 [Verrucomicrobiales bacterium]
MDMATCFLACFFSLLGFLLAGEVPDGRWNGNPWEIAELKRQAEAGEADAMAEWAYEAGQVISEVPHEPERIVDYTKRAMEKGSLLARALRGWQLREGFLEPIQAERGARLIMEAAEAGHPYAKCLLAKLILRGHFDGQAVKGVPDDLGLALKLWRESQAAGVGGLADEMTWRVLLSGAAGTVDQQGAYEVMIKQLESRELTMATLEKVHFATNGYRNHLTALFSEKDSARSREVMREAAQRGIAYADYRVAGEGLRSRSSEEVIHERMPRVLGAARLGAYPAFTHVLSFLSDNRFRGEKKANQAFTSSRAQTEKMVTLLFRNGLYRNSDLVTPFYAYHQGLKVKKGAVTDDELVTHYRLRMALFPEHDYHSQLADYLGFVARANEDQKMAERVIALYVLNSVSQTEARSKLALFLAKKKAAAGEKALWAATMRACFDELPKKWKHYNWTPEMKKRFEKGWAQMRPEEKAEADRLYEAGYPMADEFRKAAFEVLQETGDIDRNEVFQPREAAGEPKDEVWRRDEGAGERLATSHSSLEVSLVNDRRREVLRAYLAGEKLVEADGASLAALWLSEPGELRAMVEEEKKNGEERAQKILARMEKPVLLGKRLGGKVGWYFVLEEELLSARPYFHSLANGGRVGEAGILAGDVVAECFGIKLSGVDVRNRFALLLDLWPEELPVDLGVLRSEKKRGAQSFAVRDAQHQIRLTLGERKN